MVSRVLIFGNCHAQYLGAALQATTKLDVVVAGKLFEGPIHFDTKPPRMKLLPDALAWVKASPEKPVLIYQATPQSRYDLTKRLLNEGVEHDVVKFPYIKFDVLEIKKQDDPETERALIKRAIRSDRVFNELSIISAGGDPQDLIPNLKSVIADAPNNYSNNHFTGAIFAEIFAFMRRSALADLLGPSEFEAFLAAVREDKGVSHLLGTVPTALVSEALGITWTLNDLANARYRELQAAGSVKHLKTRATGVVDFTVFRILQNDYKRAKQIRSLRLILELYKDQRLYLSWAGLIADMFIERGRHARAATVLLNRMAWDDARGSAFAMVLARLFNLSKSESAKRVFGKYAKAYPDPNIQLAWQCIQQFG